MDKLSYSFFLPQTPQNFLEIVILIMPSAQNCCFKFITHRMVIMSLTQTKHTWKQIIPQLNISTKSIYASMYILANSKDKLCENDRKNKTKN